MKSSDLLSAANKLALSRLISEVENETSAGKTALDDCFSRSGKAHLIGVTGAPGTGKSSLVNRLAQLIRREGKQTVAIVAIDPSSPFTGGAILGDRVRMRDLSGDPGVFIRSMASRGELGGLARTTAGVVQLMDAAGYDLILIETVGAGQSEVDIARLAHTTIVVESPGMGDDIQAIKAGILEIADILVVNKADRPGIENTERALRANLELGYSHRVNGKAGHGGFKEENTIVNSEEWVPPVIKTIATEETGFPELIKAITSHRDYLQKTGLLAQRERERLMDEFEHILRHTLVQNWKAQVSTENISRVMDAVYSRKRSPASAVEELTRPAK
ncbi:MAG: methylmalonyl Co-A mutase-associated GTPase MeaB [Anaerolineae bacterium]|nr:methylmalonyl Co-A mutase-associated GTPase MeaB [Anaerolineae bacterium]